MANDVRERFTRLLEDSQPDGVTSQMLNQNFKGDAFSALVPVINEMLGENRLEMFRLEGGRDVVYKLRGEAAGGAAVLGARRGTAFVEGRASRSGIDRGAAANVLSGRGRHALRADQRAALGAPGRGAHGERGHLAARHQVRDVHAARAGAPTERARRPRVT